MIARLLVAHVVVVAVVLCVARGDVSGTNPTSLTPGTVVDSSGCPVEDESVASSHGSGQRARAGDDEALLGLSRVDTIVCDDVAPEYFPECETGAVFYGYGISDPYFVVNLVDENAYADHLDTITGRVDPSFSDEFGDGRPRIIGVGTCGPDIPGRRTYHLA